MEQTTPRQPGTPEYGHGVPSLLLIEAAGTERRTVREVLEAASGMLRIDHVTTFKDGLARLAAQPVSAVLLDLTLPEARTLTAIDDLRRVAPKVAIMILAPASEQALARRAVDRGANDAIVTYLNAEAEGLTGWTRAEAFARPISEVFDVTDGLTGQHAQDPSRLAIEHQKKVRLKGNYILVGRRTRDCRRFRSRSTSRRCSSAPRGSSKTSCASCQKRSCRRSISSSS